MFLQHVTSSFPLVIMCAETDDGRNVLRDFCVPWVLDVHVSIHIHNTWGVRSVALRTRNNGSGASPNAPHHPSLNALQNSPVGGCPISRVHIPTVVALRVWKLGCCVFDLRCQVWFFACLGSVCIASSLVPLRYRDTTRETRLIQVSPSRTHC